MTLRFAGFQLDRSRAELRSPIGEPIKLRPKTLALLRLFAENPGRVLSKSELMDSIWPNVHVGDDSLFQCIREIRTAIGDDQRKLVRLVSGHGYLFEPEVSTEIRSRPPAEPPDIVPPPPALAPADEPPVTDVPVSARPRFGSRRALALATGALSVIVGGVAIATLHRSPFPAGPEPLVLAVMPITASTAEANSIATNVTLRLADGLAKIDNIRVTVPQGAAPGAAAPHADYILHGEVQKSDGSWDVWARITRATTGEVVWTSSSAIKIGDTDLSLQQSRLAASIGHPLALRLGALVHPAATPATADRNSPPGSAKVVIEQATASIMQTTRDRFATAQTMLESALAGDPDNVDLAVSLAALQLRGIQMVWYSPADSAAATTRARATLEHALRIRPSSIPVLEAYCRFLNATNEFVESLVACARTLNFDPWNGLALYHIGLAQLQLGRFDDALATFQQANRFDTPEVSRWTWPLGIGLTYLIMGRSADAVPWLLKSIAITPASGRPHMLLAAAYEQLGQHDKAKAAMAKALALRPGSNAANVKLPPKNASAAYLAAAASLDRSFVAAGLPEH